MQDAAEYAECEAIVKDYPPFKEAMKKRGIEDMDLVMVDPWLVSYFNMYCHEENVDMLLWHALLFF